MKTKILFAISLLFAVTVLSAQEAKYGIKSAIIKKDVVAMGQKVECHGIWMIMGRKNLRNSL